MVSKLTGRLIVNLLLTPFVIAATVSLTAFAAPFDIARDNSGIAAREQQDQTRPDTVIPLAPRVIGRTSLDPNATGILQTDHPSGPTLTRKNAFFKVLGTNGRTCFSCHQGDQGWSVTPEKIQSRFRVSAGSDAIFRPVDGAVCPTADMSSLAAKTRAYGLLLDRGLFRIALSIPENAQFSIVSVDDPHGCNMSPATGLTSPTTGTVSFYRRPLPSTNLKFLTTVMWDGREGKLLPEAPARQKTIDENLAGQAIDAVNGHEQGEHPPTKTEIAEMVAFEMDLTTAQAFDKTVLRLDGEGATGGVKGLSRQPFHISINDSGRKDFNKAVFHLYDSWINLSGDSLAAARTSVARGQDIFNNRTVTIFGVGGFNDDVHRATLAITCSNCHDTPNSGSHSEHGAQNIGVTGAGADAPPALNIAGLPVFTVQCSVATGFHPANTPFTVTDLGMAMITGACADVGKTKVPILRGLAGRAPYFHNGSAATLADVVDFYNQRFNIGLSDQDKADLAAFLQTL